MRQFCLFQFFDSGHSDALRALFSHLELSDSFRSRLRSSQAQAYISRWTAQQAQQTQGVSAVLIGYAVITILLVLE